MLTAREAFEHAKKHATNSPEMQARLAEVEAMLKTGELQLPEPDQKPEMIVGGPWPNTVPGVQRFECGDCRGYIGLSPDSGAAYAAKYPDVPVLCYACAKRRA